MTMIDRPLLPWERALLLDYELACEKAVRYDRLLFEMGLLKERRFLSTREAGRHERLEGRETSYT